MKNIKLIACDTDGVVLEDTFSPLLHKIAQQINIPYTEEVERNTFSRNDKEALKYIKKIAKINSDEKMKHLYNLYFQEREKYIINSKKNPVINGAEQLLNRLRTLNVKIICYGGLQFDQVDDRAKNFLSKFDEYICTGDFRPGIKEIVTKIYKLKYSEVLFIDDVNTVAEEAKKLNIRFIGVPTKHSWGFQYEDMKKTGVKYLVDSIDKINVKYLKELDLDNNPWY